MNKSIRTKSGLGGRPKGEGVRHDTPQPVVTQADESTQEIEEDLDDIREAIRVALTKNIPNIGKWLEAVGEEDPKSALTLYKDYTEFVLPKLQRTDSKIDPSAPVQLVFENISAHVQRMKEKNKKNTPDDY
jgi:hypothetical protein